MVKGTGTVINRRIPVNIGFIGLGIMGSRMAVNLAKAGHQLYVYNRTKDKAKNILSNRIIWKDNPSQVAMESEVLITMLSAPEAVREIALGENGFLDSLEKGNLWMDCSTVNPSFSREMAGLATQRGIHFLDAPVGGSRIPAEKGELVFFVGGEENDFRKCEPLFQVMGKKYIYLGGHGSGTSLKIVFNLLLGHAMAAFAEGMALGVSLGLDKEKLLDILVPSYVEPPFMELKKPKLEQNDYGADFPLKWMHKDLQLASQTAFEQGIALPGVNVIKELYQLASQSGYAEKDFSAIFQFFQDNLK
jgi:3-hydroxyisobutyrate dehydrogenase-like beta-hydroxyacid dehydrogenase